MSTLKEKMNGQTNTTALILNGVAIYIRLQPNERVETALFKYLDIRKKVIEQLERLNIHNIDWAMIEGAGILSVFSPEQFLTDDTSAPFLFLASHLHHKNNEQIEEGFEKLYSVGMDLAEKERLSDNFFDALNKEDYSLIKEVMAKAKILSLINKLESMSNAENND